MDLPSAKAVGLLAYLAASGKAQSRDRLLGLLWADSTEEAARKNLRNTLWGIRKAAGDDIVRSEGDRLSLSADLQIDVHQFEALASRTEHLSVDDQKLLLSLYRGPFLEGFSLPDSPDFEVWMIGERERLQQISLRTMGAVVGFHMNQGNWPEAMAIARQALSQDPLLEPMYRVLMESDARLGNRAEALRHYDLLREVMARELGVEPLPETDQLRSAILEGGLGPAPRPRLESRAERRRSSTCGGGGVPFVGRAREMKLLDEELAMATSGEPRVALLVGEIGIGKSRLWGEWSAPLRQKIAVLEARCLASTQALPFAPLAELFGQRPVLDKIAGQGSAVSPLWLAELARLVPELRVLRPDLPAPAQLPVQEVRHRLLEAMARCLVAQGGDTQILFVDDLHWADGATLDWLDYLMHRAQGRHLLLVGTYRPDEASAHLARLVAGWSREAIVTRLLMEGLSAEEAASLSACLGVDSSLVQQLFEWAGGNPYFLIELSSSPSGETPPALVELVRARMGRMSAAARQILQAAAVLEPDFDYPALRRISGRGEEETLDALDELLDAGILVERERGYHFAHPLAAMVVREGLSGARRSFLHRRAAEALEATHAGHLPQVAGSLVDHYLQAGEPERAASFAEMAAARAMELSAAAEAASFYRKALSLQPSISRRLGLGDALRQMGDVEGSRASYLQALAESQASEDQLGASRACLAMADSYLGMGRPDEVRRWADRSRGYLDPAADPASHAHSHFLLGWSLMNSWVSLEEAEFHLQEASRLAEESGLREMAARSRFELGNLMAQRGEIAPAVVVFEESARMARAAGAQFLEVLGYNNAAYNLILLGDLPAAHSHIDAALELAESRSLRLPLEWLYSTRGELALAERRWDEAEVWINRSMAEAERHKNEEQIANCRANLGLVARGRGDLDGALVMLLSAQEEADKLLAPRLQSQIDLFLAELFLMRKEKVAALESLERAESRLAGGQYPRMKARAAELRRSI